MSTDRRDLWRGRLQGIAIALAAITLIGGAAALGIWWVNRPRTPNLGAPIYRGSTLERSIENAEDRITTHYLLAPADREQLFDYYRSTGADCSEGMCHADLTPCGTYYAYISGTTEGVTRYALEIRREDCSQ
jgi:hypothetical protein